MTTTVADDPVPARLLAGHTIALVVGSFLLVSFVIYAVLLLLDRPPDESQVTLLGTTDELHILAEGAGGGRVLIGGGSSGSELPALLGRQLAPFRRDLDLVIVVDRRDLLGATELVRRGQARAVVTIGLDDDRAAAPALAVLRDLCAQRAIPFRLLAAPERISLGRDGGLTIDLYPAIAEATVPRVRLAAGAFSAALVLGEAVPEPALAAIVPRGSQERFRAAAAGSARVLIAPTVPAESRFERILPVAAGQRSTFTLGGETVRLRGGVLTTLDTARAAR